MEGEWRFISVLERCGGKERLVGGGWLEAEGGVEEEVVVRVTAEGSSKLDGQWGYVDVEEALVRSIGWSARPERRGQEVDVTAVEGANGG